MGVVERKAGKIERKENEFEVGVGWGIGTVGGFGGLDNGTDGGFGWVDNGTVGGAD